MSHHTYKHIELTGSSEVCSDDAIRNAIESASKSIKNMDWFEVVETRGHISESMIKHWQVTIKIGFRLEN
ncbi:MAG: dodecin family protein [Cycloclasticus sp.]|nr:dodecin family protein [Cycloclasticus sp.]